MDLQDSWAEPGSSQAGRDAGSSYLISACALELVTRTRKSSPSVAGRSSQYTASPVAWLRAERCMMGRPTGSCSPCSAATGCGGHGWVSNAFGKWVKVDRSRRS